MLIRTRIGTAIAALVPIMALLVTAETPASAVVPGVNGKIAFVRTDDWDMGRSEILAINADGTDQTTIIGLELQDAGTSGLSNTVWSPDAGTVAYQSAGDIWLMNPDGSWRRLLVSNARGPTWSPDGTRVAFYGKAGNDSENTDDEISVINIDGSGQAQLTHNPTNDRHPAWSPDGLTIAYSTANLGLMTMNADGSGQTMVTTGTDEGTPAWSPDGARIAYARPTTGGGIGIFVMDASGEDRHNITPGVGINASPSWSPDGSKIAYSHLIAATYATPEQTDIFVMSPDGDNQFNATDSPAFERWPSWGVPSPKCQGRTVTIYGTSAGNNLMGTDGADVIAGLGGGDSINGSGGNDAICGGDGSDLLDGGTGSDAMSGGNGTDQVTYAARTSPVTASLSGSTGDDGSAEDGAAGSRDSISTDVEWLAGGSSDDLLTGGSGANLLIGNAGNDTFDGGAGADSVQGGDGIDTATYASRTTPVTANLTGGGGDDGSSVDGASGARDNIDSDVERLTGGSANDSLTGNDGPNLLTGGKGNDTLFGKGGNDTLDGDDGNDTLVGGNGGDAMSGGAGVDTVSYSDYVGGVTVTIGDGKFNDGSTANDAKADNVGATVENVRGSQGNDVITGNSLANQIFGLLGADTLNGAGGSDRLSGDAGNDSLYGSTGNDSLYGFDGADKLFGYSGNDYLNGGTGADSFDGQADKDTLYAKDGVRDSLINCGTGTDPAPVRDAGDPAPVNCP